MIGHDDTTRCPTLRPRATPFDLPHAIDDAEKGEAITAVSLLEWVHPQSQWQSQSQSQSQFTVPASQLLVTSKCTTCRYLWLWEQAAWQPPLKPQNEGEGERERKGELLTLFLLLLLSLSVT